MLVRDARVVIKQEKIAACLAAIGKGLSQSIKKDFEG